ncbi:DUF3160 domain-containing protein [Aquimarina sp. 2201CG5-10]|uniref:DUF3160 domain-containing protein n=1 Tax=Aquimarina callyspongiae TaxID=3098150 RepID=UPI002AB3A50D|nr:DUF3160 domain-containing protein [Aquimarina sp. 2201CG5-10]MDY8136828.1 DUF3160 domain-containing protein [Aquimarina sp. 2201CG5-10]
MKTNSILFYLILSVLLFANCNKKQKENDTTPQKEVNKTRDKDSEQEEKTLSNADKIGLEAYYELPHIKEFYDWMEMEYTPLEELNYPKDLSVLPYDELRLLRNEIYARNGHLFSDGFLRGHFNQFKWYMPIFEVDDFEVMLSAEEETLVNKILAEEARRKGQKMKEKEGLQLYNADLIVNKKQFAEISEKILEDFKNQNFSIVSANRAMPFYAYDENAYQYIPHYITTDLYLFILHKYFSKSIEKLDENYMQNQLKNILKGVSGELNKLLDIEGQFQPIIEWTQMYNALAQYAIGDTSSVIPSGYQEIFNEEKNKINALAGKPSFIENTFVNYKELKPRGHYTKNDTLQKYFRAFKWISLNGISLKNDQELKGLILFAHLIKNNKRLLKQYEDYVAVMEKLAGQEDNLSLTDVINIISIDNSLEEALSDSNMTSIRKKLDALDKEKIKRVFGETFKTEERDNKRVYFLSSTYSISGDIFSKLVHVDGEKSKRPFPSGLDVPAVFNNKMAQSILTNEYQVDARWPEYLTRLKNLQDQFKDFDDWDHNYGYKGVQTALASNAEKDNYPDFMKTDAYNRKELSTSLASWTHIKHDLILYQEKPFAAEAGQGGGPEPPKHYSYVEPNLEFWDTAIELVNWLETLSEFESSYGDELKEIKAVGEKLRNAAYKQLEGKQLTSDEHAELHYIGGTIEYILFGLLETDHLPERESSMALIADVYVYNNKNLNVAVGHADDIYTIVPIKGEYYIARGSVFSYYEFTGQIYNDEEWRAKIKNNNAPERPMWIKPIINEVKPLKGQMQFRY